MTRGAERYERVFKTAWFVKAAKKADIDDDELCTAIRQVMLGQADDLGGGVWKKRLSRNQYRSIIVAKGGQYWVYAYLFAKQDQANINTKELAELRSLADFFAHRSDSQMTADLNSRQLVEICHAERAEVQQRDPRSRT
jgi:hypothetical protein